MLNNLNNVLSLIFSYTMGTIPTWVLLGLLLLFGVTWRLISVILRSWSKPISGGVPTPLRISSFSPGKMVWIPLVIPAVHAEKEIKSTLIHTCAQGGERGVRFLTHLLENFKKIEFYYLITAAKRLGFFLFFLSPPPSWRKNCTLVCYYLFVY